jgi:CBS domain-containing protein
MVDHRTELEDEEYFERPRARRGLSFDSDLLREPLKALPVRQPLVFSTSETVTEAMRAMQSEHRGCVIVTDDGTPSSKLSGIFTERDVLFRIVDQGRNPATLPLADVMTPDPEVLPVKSTVAHALNKMSLGGFRHLPVVDEDHRPAFVVSVRDIVGFLVEAFPREVFNLPDLEVSTARSREGA